jgi:hypothetical protein
MSETAQTLITRAYRTLNAIAVGESPTTDELAEGLSIMKMMFRHWAALNIRIPYITMENFALTGAESYTIGSGGNFDTVRPAAIRGGYIRDSNGYDSIITIVDENWYRGISLKSLISDGAYMWYSPEYPLGKIFLYPVGGSRIYIDTLKPFTEPALVSSSISFPPEYDEAIVNNLAVRLAPGLEKEPSVVVVALAASGLKDIETRNFASQLVAIGSEVTRLASGGAAKYDINAG